MTKSTTLILSDLHYPFAHPDHLDFLKAVKKKYKPDHVVCIGDEVDSHGLSNWDHDPDGMSAGDELKKALKDLQKLYKVFPDVKVCTSNHTARPFRRAYKYGIPRAYMKDYKEFLQAPKGWQWSDYWEIEGILFEHGEGFTGAQGAIKAAEGNAQSTVIGHIHSFAGIMWSANPRQLIFGMNVGCLIDRDSYAFAYGAKIKHKPILGCGVIVDGVPFIVPMTLDKNSKWNRKV
jgi:hypothetical protein